MLNSASRYTFGADNLSANLPIFAKGWLLMLQRTLSETIIIYTHQSLYLYTILGSDFNTFANESTMFWNNSFVHFFYILFIMLLP